MTSLRKRLLTSLVILLDYQLVFCIQKLTFGYCIIEYCVGVCVCVCERMFFACNYIFVLYLFVPILLLHVSIGLPV